MVAELLGTGPKSKKVNAEVRPAGRRAGPGTGHPARRPAGELSRAGGSLLAEAITRLRAGAAHEKAGYDGEYGVIRLFEPGELDRGTAALFDMAAAGSLAGAVPAPREPGHQRAVRPPPRDRHPTAGAPGRRRVAGQGGEARGGAADRASPAAPGGSLLDRLDPEQRAAAAAAAPLMIIAGPGTGKTRTLTHRLAAAVAEQGVPAEACLALTFTRRAAEEMRRAAGGAARPARGAAHRDHVPRARADDPARAVTSSPG